MKLKCKQDHWPAKSGVLGIGAKPRTKIEGLTEGKDYNGSPLAELHDWVANGGSLNTTITFLIYNDNSEWETYQLNLFEPAT